MVMKCRVCRGAMYSAKTTHEFVEYTLRKCTECPYWTCDIVGAPNAAQETDKSEHRRARSKR